MSDSSGSESESLSPTPSPPPSPVSKGKNALGRPSRQSTVPSRLKDTIVETEECDLSSKLA